GRADGRRRRGSRPPRRGRPVRRQRVRQPVRQAGLRTARVSGRRIRLITEGFPEPPTRDTAVSHAILRRVSDGLEPETLRLHRPGAIVAFGPIDRHTPGFQEAVDAARAAGYEAILRLAGGRAAVFHEDTIAFSWVVPDPSP